MWDRTKDSMPVDKHSTACSAYARLPPTTYVCAPVLQTLTVLYKHGEAEMSTLLFWQYLASVATLPAYMWLFLRIIHAWV